MTFALGTLPVSQHCVSMAVQEYTIEQLRSDINRWTTNMIPASALIGHPGLRADRRGPSCNLTHFKMCRLGARLGKSTRKSYLRKCMPGCLHHLDIKRMRRLSVRLCPQRMITRTISVTSATNSTHEYRAVEVGDEMDVIVGSVHWEFGCS